MMATDISRITDYKPVSELTDQDWKHPYWSFLNALKLGEITGYDDDDDPAVKMADRMPRPIIPGDKRALNKWVVESLANGVYDMELRGEAKQRVWAYRKAAWAIEDTEQDVGLIYRAMGRKGLERIENVVPRMAEVIEELIRDLSEVRMCATI